MKFSVVCSPGVGDLAILHIASHHLKKAGHEVVTVSPHRFGKWLQGYQFGEIGNPDAIFLQYGNDPDSAALRQNNNVYTFFGSHHISKHGPLKPGFDFVADLNRTMVDNVVKSLKTLFGIEASNENGFCPPQGLVHRRFSERIAIHTTSGSPFRNWPKEKFEAFAKWARDQGFEPMFLPQFPTLEALTSFIYESGYFLGNDSGPGHIASCLKIPHLIIGREERHMRHWRPGWGHGAVITPPKWIPNWKGFRLREKYWSKFISSRDVINSFKDIILGNKLF
ncbi:MAG: hypothetical protein K1X28_10965 [Parachlamydiales bacterium]|nr:hypothetical protein [Parachlamydiales bacterium]